MDGHATVAKLCASVTLESRLENKRENGGGAGTSPRSVTEYGWPAFTAADGRRCQISYFAMEDIAAIHGIEQAISLAPWSEGNFKDSVAASHWCLGVKIVDQWVAYAVFSFAADEAELLILGVHSEARRLGIAENLLALVEPPLATRARELFLEVRASNVAAIALYDKLGFNCVGERRNYYPIPGKHTREDALIYGKTMLFPE